MLQNLRNVYTKYFLKNEIPPSILLVDDGIENKGEVNKAIENGELILNKLIAQKDIVFSNSMIEAINKTMKYSFLFRNKLSNFEQTEKYLQTAVEQYNNRPHSALFGLTPLEVFNGTLPDKNLFKTQKEKAKLLRKAENKALSCNTCSFSLVKLPQN